MLRHRLACIACRTCVLAVMSFLFVKPAGANEWTPPRLVVVVVVDGLSTHAWERWHGQWVGGFARFQQEGATFSACTHDHAITRTAPGFFAIGSGRHPGPAGVLTNRMFDARTKSWVGCVDDPASRVPGEDRPAGSYRAVAASALGDWLKQSSPASQVFAFSGKDRSAILLAGRAADGAYWFDRETGRFVTSTYYRDRPHEWVDAFNETEGIATAPGARWERVVAETTVYETAARADDAAGEADLSTEPRAGRGPTFDHYLPSTRRGAKALADAMYRNPLLDASTFALARHAVVEERLGRDEDADLLWIGLSAHDNIAHATGPYSQESFDVLLRADRELGSFLEFLDDAVGVGRYVAVLTSDHGFLPLPEQASSYGFKGVRRVEMRALRDHVATVVRGRVGRDAVLAVTEEGITLDRHVVRDAGVPWSSLSTDVLTALESFDGIARAFAREDLVPPDGEGADEDVIRRRFRHNVHPTRSPDFLFAVSPGVLLTSYATGTDHGSPNDYDAHVPLFWTGTGIRPGVLDRPVHTIDVAPTIARLLGVTPPGDIDGAVLEDALIRDVPAGPFD